MNFFEISGWLGSMLFAISAIPQAIHSFKTKQSEGVTWGLLLLWFFGEIFTLIYVLPKDDVLPLLMNYMLNIVFISVILYYKLWPSVKSKNEETETNQQTTPNNVEYF